MRTLPTASFVALLVSSAWMAPDAAAQELTELVPLDAYSLMHWKHDPDMAFIDTYSREVWTAVRDARFDTLLLDVLADTGASDDDRAQAEGLVSMVGQLIGSVDWDALIENEIVYAEVANEPLPQSVPAMPSMLFAARPDPAKVARLETQLSGLLRAGDALTDALHMTVDERRLTDGSTTRTYSLKVADRSDFPLLQMAVRGDTILVGFGPGSFTDALALLNGDSREALVRTRRYKQAVGELGPDFSSLYYFDSRRFMRSLDDQLMPFLEQRTDAPWEVQSLVGEVLQLCDNVETSVTTTRVEGLTLVSECTTRYAADAIAQQNPIYVLTAGGDSSNAALLDYVPASAVSFQLSGDKDLLPLYHWALERVERYVPESADSLLYLDGIQAAMDLDIERDLLSWLGSSTVSFGLPPEYPGAQGAWISLSELRDPAGARKVLDRVVAVYDAVVPQLLERARKEMGRDGDVLPKLTIAPAEGAYSSLRTLRIEISVPGVPLPQIPPITYGVLGNLFVMTTSDEALDLALATAAGEVDGLYAHPALQDGERLPEGPVHSASLNPIGRQLAESAASIQMGASVMGMLSKQMSRKDPQGQVAFRVMAGTIQRVGQILSAIDFLDDAVSYSQVRDDGQLVYTRTTTRYVDPADR